MNLRLLRLLLLASTALSCASPPVEPPLFELVVDWQACGSRLEGGRAGECASVQVPLVWDRPDGRQIVLEVKRFPTPAATRLGQVWCLDGGPGDPGWAFDQELPAFQALSEAGWDLIVPTHRGTGNSTFLTCHDDDDAQACFQRLRAEWGDELAAFGTAESAEDVRRLITAVRIPDERVGIYGVSYGTYWAMRILHEHSDLVSAVVLDGVVPLGVDMERVGFHADGVYTRVLEECGLDHECAAELGDDPVATTRAVLSAWSGGGEGPCPASDWSAEGLRTLFAIAFTNPYLVPASFAAIRRLARCSDSDVDELRTAASMLTDALDELDDTGSSEALQSIVGAQDLFADNLDIAALSEEFDDRLIGVQIDPRDIAEWPRIGAWNSNNSLASWTVPTLTVHGGNDVQSPPLWEAEFARRASIPDSHRLLVPTGNHNLMASDVFSGCTGSVMNAFFASPESNIDRGCAESFPALDYAGQSVISEQLSRGLFGTGSLWGTP